MRALHHLLQHSSEQTQLLEWGILIPSSPEAVLWTWDGLSEEEGHASPAAQSWNQGNPAEVTPLLHQPFLWQQEEIRGEAKGLEGGACSLPLPLTTWGCPSASCSWRQSLLLGTGQQTDCFHEQGSRWQQMHSQKGLCLPLPHRQWRNHAKALYSALQPQMGPLWTVANSLDHPEENANHPVVAAVGHFAAYCEGPDQNSSGNVSLQFDPTLKALLIAPSL